MRPATIEGRQPREQERRRYGRKLRYGMVSVTREGSDALPFRVPLVNISLGGIFLRSPVRPPSGEELDLRIQFVAGPCLHARAAVVRGEDEGFGCHFLFLGDSDLSTLQYWMGPYGALAPAPLEEE